MSLKVFCLCAEWCRTCGDFRLAFDEVARARDSDRFAWVDVETHDDLLLRLDIEIETFPTLLILDAQRNVRFAGPVTPFAETVRRLCRSSEDGSIAAPPSSALVLHAQELIEALDGPP